jgi:transcriptional regulator with XRE-family HTH domain
MLGDKLKKAIKTSGLSYARVASELGISEGSLYNILKKESFEVSYLLKASALFGLPISYFLEDPEPTSAISQTGDFNQAGSGNIQKIKSSKAPSQELAADLAACQREKALLQALVQKNDEIITLLRGSHNSPN